MIYPPTRRENHTDILHGIPIADPYRWLEDPDSPETQAWIAAQNQLTQQFLAQIPERPQIEARLTQLWNYERIGIPFRQGGKWFYFHNSGLQNQNVLYQLTEAGAVAILDPNGLAEDGTVALTGVAVSEDGRWLAYGVSTGGSDWQTWRIRDLETGTDLPDQIEWVKFSGVSWTHDHQGFYYSRFPAPTHPLEAVNTHHKLYYHRLGSPQSEDRLIYERPDQPTWGFSPEVSESGEYLFITVWQGTENKNLLLYQELRDPEGPIQALVGEWVAQYQLIGQQGRRCWLQTNAEAPRGRVVRVDLGDPDSWQEVIPESADTLVGVSWLHGQLIASYLQDAHARVKIFDLAGVWQRDVSLPGLGSVSGFGGKSTDRETYFSFTNFVTPPTIYHYDLVTHTSRLYAQPRIDFHPEDYEVKQVFYTSRDGTQIPMFITHKKGIPLRGDHPTYLYGYGGFNIALTPSFSVGMLVWLEMGGIYAVANCRGGGEYGEAWHEAGKKHHKQNVFDDFIAAAEWLIAQGYTCPQKLAIGGGSNGGLLVAACMVQRPDLFAAVLPAVGVLDMLRFHKFTIGWAWIGEYGDPDNPDEFSTLLSYSPLHRLQPGTCYPATLITTADHDDRVVPAHSFKFAAALQYAQGGTAPILIRIEARAGHGAGKPTAKQIAEIADKWAFVWHVLHPQSTSASMAAAW
ncbi:MAG: prolyl oligopeptidase family serine peptidase [Thermostichales cyanobacterium DRC_bins_46]